MESERYGVPKRYQDKTFATWREGEARGARAMVESWCERQERGNRPWCLTILGMSGTGKTHLATAAFIHWLEIRTAVNAGGYWLDAAEAMHTLRSEVALPPSAIRDADAREAARRSPGARG